MICLHYFKSQSFFYYHFWLCIVCRKMMCKHNSCCNSSPHWLHCQCQSSEDVFAQTAETPQALSSSAEQPYWKCRLLEGFVAVQTSEEFQKWITIRHDMKKKRSVPLQMVCRRDICSCRLAGVARSDCTPRCNTGAVDILVAHLSQGPHCALFDLATLFLCVRVFFSFRFVFPCVLS